VVVLIGSVTCLTVRLIRNAASCNRPLLSHIVSVAASLSLSVCRTAIHNSCLQAVALSLPACLFDAGSQLKYKKAWKKNKNGVNVPKVGGWRSSLSEVNKILYKMTHILAYAVISFTVYVYDARQCKSKLSTKIQNK